MSGTNSNISIAPNNQVAKANVVSTPSAPSTKEIINSDKVTLGTLEDLKNTLTKKKEKFPVDLDNPNLYNTTNKIKKSKEENNKNGTEKEKVVSKEE